MAERWSPKPKVAGSIPARPASKMTLKDLKSKIVAVPDWPKKGVVFRDITPALEDKKCLRFLIDELAKMAGEQGIDPVRGREGSQRASASNGVDKVVGIDARGFILAAPLAYKLKAGLAIARKKGKLPRATVSETYNLEYASEIIEMHQDSIKKGERILLVDDVLATGGTMASAVKIVGKLGGKVAGVLFFIELKDLAGRAKLKGQKIKSLIKF